MLLPRACPGCQDSAPLAVTASGGTFYLGWICARCLAVDAKDGLLDIIGVHATSEDAEMDLLTENTGHRSNGGPRSACSSVAEHR
jgi:hypothetical protein